MCKNETNIFDPRNYVLKKPGTIFRGEIYSYCITPPISPRLLPTLETHNSLIK